MSTPARLASFVLAAAVLSAIASSQSFQSGDLYIVTTSLNPPVPPPFMSPGITRVDPFTGTASLVRLVNGVQSNATYDAFRGRLVFMGTPTSSDPSGVWGFDSAGGATLL